MEYQATDNEITVRLDVNDPVKESIREVVITEEVTAAVITGLGALKNFTLGYFQPDAGEYKRDEFSESHELTNASGIISQQEGEPHIHLHVTLAGPDHKAIGGHLHEGQIAAAGEFFLLPVDSKITRTHNSNRNLDLMQFSDD